MYKIGIVITVFNRYLKIIIEMKKIFFIFAVVFISCSTSNNLIVVNSDNSGYMITDSDTTELSETSVLALKKLVHEDDDVLMNDIKESMSSFYEDINLDTISIY